MSRTRPRVLTIAGSDSGGGAGIQADLKTICCLGGYGMSAITALTAQNTVGVECVFAVPADFVARQIRVCAEDIGVDAAKTGMLFSADIVEAAAEALAAIPGLRLVVDPVMVAKSGDRLLVPEAEQALADKLLALAELVTPNVPEAEALAGVSVRTDADLRRAAVAIHGLGARNVLIKGGHREGESAVDLLYDGEVFREFTSARLPTRNTHGTGCTLSAALATELAFGRSVPEAVARAKRFIAEAIRHGLDLGHGHGPTDPLAAARAVRRSSSP